MKKIKYLIAISTVFLASCSDYVDVNQDESNVKASEATPDLYMPAAMLRAYGNQSTAMNQLGNVFMNSWSPNVFSFTGGFTRETNLIIDNTFYQNIFNQTSFLNA